jgi:hypothetical protein
MAMRRLCQQARQLHEALPHNQLGEVDLNAYATFVKAPRRKTRMTSKPSNLSGAQADQPAGRVGDRMLEGPDSHHVTLPPPPALASAEAAGEAVELYWMALARRREL